MNSPVMALFIDSLNETLDLQASRLAAAAYGRLPDSIWATLFVLVFFGMGSVGYQLGIINNRCWPITYSLVISFAIVMTMISDLDRPLEGFLRASKAPLRDLAKKIGTPQSQKSN